MPDSLGTGGSVTSLRIISTTAWSLISVCFTPIAVGAQLCSALPSLTGHPVQVMAQYSRHRFTDELGASVNFGGSLHGRIGGAWRRDSELRANLWEFTTGLGYDLKLGNGKLIGCPTVELIHSWGPSNTVQHPGRKISRAERRIGVGVAGTIDVYNQLVIYPATSLKFVHLGHEFRTPESDFNFPKDVYWLAAFSVGIPITPRFTIIPGVSLPLGAESGRIDQFEHSFGFVTGRDNNFLSWSITMGIGLGR